MNVLYISNGYGPHDHRFLEAIRRQGARAVFLSRETNADVETRPLPKGVRRLEPFGRAAAADRLGLQFAGHLRRVLREVRVDLVHAGPVQDCAWPAARAGAPHLVTMSWGSDILQRARFGLGRWLARAALRRSSGFLGDCEAVRERAVQLGAAPDRTVIFPWGVDLKRFRPAGRSNLRRQLGWDSRTVVISLRAWEPRYGIEEVLTGFQAAANRDPSLRLILAGDGSLRSRVLRRIEADGLRKKVWLPGYVDYSDLPAFYQASDIYLSLSRSDGSSVSLLEAMACGLPVVVSDIPGNREWVEPGGNGYLVPLGRPRSLTETLISAASDTQARRGMGRRGRALAEQRADWEKNSPRLMDAYRLALEDPA